MLYRGKAMSNRWRGGSTEAVAEKRGTDDNKSEDDANYRRLHHHIVVTYEDNMNVCLNILYAEHSGNGEQDGSEVKDEELPWMARRVASYKAFKIWLVFLLTDFSAYMAFWTVVRTGNFKLRMAAMCRFAPIFCMTGKNRYHSLAAHHLFDLAAMAESDLKVLSEILRERGQRPLCACGYGPAAEDVQQVV